MNPSLPLRIVFATLLVAWFGVVPVAATERPAAPLLLVSLDGFRWDYCALHPEETPNLRRLAREGVSAEALIPVFPSQTFAAHYSIVTGLYPAQHGIISNRFFDPELGVFFHYKIPNSLHDPRLWGGEPIWITAEKQGRRSACYFWPGSEVLGEVRPTIAKKYDYSIPFEKRLDELVGWLQRPEDKRPDIITFYLEETNSAGHYYGVDAPQTLAAIKLLDERVGRIVERLRAENIPINLVIVSDHGMAPIEGPERTAILDDYVDPTKIQVDFDGAVAGLRVLEGTAEDLVQQLSALPKQYRVYHAKDLPPRWRLIGSPRIPDVWVVPEPGWRIQLRAFFDAANDKFLKGDHGYDSASPLMHGILIAHGPSFKNDGAILPAVESIHIYNLMCAALGLTPAPNSGDDRLVEAFLQPE